MASRTITLYVDDLDGTEIKQGKGGPVTFGLDGQDYSVDLTEKNAAELRKLLQRYIDVAGKVTRKAGTKAKKLDGPSPAELRAWAADNGFDVPTRGRIPDSIRTAWESK
ncbi:Lsr2 family protein [Nocardioides sp. WS12]|uniref:histone-like nucleoid-structuring protein Lsr2 n=1 Tax=Nocardioides sp. WS12 TaxID=2486272 RepID=UPI0015FE7E70|nr:Lsr2 family protein [Nocardioides sp. WS12]